MPSAELSAADVRKVKAKVHGHAKWERATLLGLFSGACGANGVQQEPRLRTQAEQAKTF